MTDVIQIAQERRAQLRAELQKIEEFLRMADSLTREGTGATASEEDAGDMAAIGGDTDKGNGGALRTNLFRQSGTNG